MSLSLLSALPFQIEFFALSACGLLIAWLVVFILIAVWVYRDAESRGMSGGLWLIIVILLGLIGLIVYLIVRSSHPVGGMPPGYPAYPPPYQTPPPAAAGASMVCRSCGAPLTPGAGFCPSCGARI